MPRTLLCRLDTMKALVYRISITGYRHIHHPEIEESRTSRIPRSDNHVNIIRSLLEERISKINEHPEMTVTHSLISRGSFITADSKYIRTGKE